MAFSAARHAFVEKAVPRNAAVGAGSPAASTAAATDGQVTQPETSSRPICSSRNDVMSDRTLTMASLIRKSNRYFIQFRLRPNAGPITIALGDVPESQAKNIRSRVEELIKAVRADQCSRH